MLFGIVALQYVLQVERPDLVVEVTLVNPARRGRLEGCAVLADCLTNVQFFNRFFASLRPVFADLPKGQQHLALPLNRNILLPCLHVGFLHNFAGLVVVPALTLQQGTYPVDFDARHLGDHILVELQVGLPGGIQLLIRFVRVSVFELPFSPRNVQHEGVVKILSPLGSLALIEFP